MQCLKKIHPNVEKEFQCGNFTVHKTLNRFSAIAIDHAHKQNNKCVKGDGGVIGITENSSQLLRWMVSGPEVARVVNEMSYIENGKFNESKFKTNRHKHVNNLCSTFSEYGNPFKETTGDLLVLDNHDIASEDIVSTIT